MRIIVVAIAAVLALSACSSRPDRMRTGSIRSHAKPHPDIGKPPVEYAAPRTEPLIEPDHDPFAAD
ncbi:hypothetical protein QNA08_12230 [Chelatococcus sp. SYSU_G07232]|uniref:Argininosuccinate lyase n=1 Tax=Chelatococcus albus TaxID=3047466 RepID=A0ABT7AI11_9HYPH|nr:hypothetical protein [Chelatococcus sp. SYSU_G07232]MDJ1159003.1 hypothetical protein [Chelatococcus sp. SYSU_G07232]